MNIPAGRARTPRRADRRSCSSTRASAARWSASTDQPRHPCVPRLPAAARARARRTAGGLRAARIDAEARRQPDRRSCRATAPCGCSSSNAATRSSFAPPRNGTPRASPRLRVMRRSRELAGGATHGRLALTLDPRGAGTLYQGIVALDATSIAALDRALPRNVRAAPEPPVARRRAKRRCRGLLAAAPAGDAATATRRRGRDLPATRRARSQRDRAAGVRRCCGRCSRTTTCASSIARPVTFRCKCSLARVANALRIAGRDEIEAALAERGGRRSDVRVLQSPLYVHSPTQRARSWRRASSPASNVHRFAGAVRRSR